jgi:hypothetical protein
MVFFIEHKISLPIYMAVYLYNYFCVYVALRIFYNSIIDLLSHRSCAEVPNLLNQSYMPSLYSNISIQMHNIFMFRKIHMMLFLKC